MHENLIFARVPGKMKRKGLISVFNGIAIIETLQGVIGSGENGVKKYREQGAWGQKYQGAGSKGK